MILEDLLYEAKVLDERIRERYHNLGKKLENNDISRYLGAGISSVGGIILNLYGFNEEYKIIKNASIVPDFLYYTTYLYLTQAQDFARNIIEPTFKNKDCKTINNSLVETPKDFDEIWGNAVRLPILGASIGYIGKAITEFYSYIQTGNSEQLKDGIESLSASAGFFLTASSIYLKDRKPTRLDKPSLKERLKNWAKGKMGNLMPEPILIQ